MFCGLAAEGPTPIGSRSRVEIRLFGFSPEGDTSLPVCVSHRIWGAINPKGVYCDTSLHLPFAPIRSNLAGLVKSLAVGSGLNEFSLLASRKFRGFLKTRGLTLDFLAESQSSSDECFYPGIPLLGMVANSIFLCEIHS